MENETSPRKKKMKIDHPEKSLKRCNENEIVTKRLKIETENVDVQALKRKNFVTSCEQVSYKAYFDYYTRLQLICLPTCVDEMSFKHNEHRTDVKVREMPNYAEESVKIEIKTNMWLEALEVCQMCIMPDQYLSAYVLKEIVEIMMNAHEDSFADYTIGELIDNCQQILSQNFYTHPPCVCKELRNCYNHFLTSPLVLKEKTFTNRTQFDHEKGIVKYCLNRLEYEISSQSKDGPLVDKYENIPEDMKQSVKGMHWQKEKFEIFECLKRPERIQRLMAVLESLVELLQYDLAIWHSRHTNNSGCHIMRSNKPLMAYVLWSSNVLYTGAVNSNCRQILRLFIFLIHLQYPEEHIHILTTWLNIIIQTFYICESDSNKDYPNIGKYCAAFSKEFYKILSELPQDSIIRVLERVQPTFMQHLISKIHVQTLLSTQEDNIIKIFIDIMKSSKLDTFSRSDRKIHITKSTVIKPKKVKNIIKYLIKKIKDAENEILSQEVNENSYLKFDTSSLISNSIIDQNIVVHALYITMEAYLDAYNVQVVQETLDNLNEQLAKNGTVEHNFLPEFTSYSVTENFIKKYRSIYQLLTELILLLNDIKERGKLPQCMSIFENLGLFEL